MAVAGRAPALCALILRLFFFLLLSSALPLTASQYSPPLPLSEDTEHISIAPARALAAVLSPPPSPSPPPLPSPLPAPPPESPAADEDLETPMGEDGGGGGGMNGGEKAVIAGGVTVAAAVGCVAVVVWRKRRQNERRSLYIELF